MFKNTSTANSLTTNTFQVQDSKINPGNHKRFSGPHGNYYIAIKNVDESSSASCTIYTGIDDNEETITIKQQEIIYYFIKIDGNDIMISNHASTETNEGSMIEVKFYYRNAKNENSSHYLEWGYSIKTYSIPGEYLLFIQPVDVNLIIRDKLNNYQLIQHPENYKVYHIAQMTSRGIFLYYGDGPGPGPVKTSCTVHFYQHI